MAPAPSGPSGYLLLQDQAARAFHRGEHRRAADLYRESFEATSAKWARPRYHILHGFASILKEVYFAPSRQDWDFLEGVLKDRSEPKVYRCQAAFALALLRWDARQREEAAAYYRDAIELGERASAQERRKMITTNMDEVSGIVGERSVGGVIDEILKAVKGNLAVMEQGGVGAKPTQLYRSDGTRIPSSARFSNCLGPLLSGELTPAQMEHLLAVGGTRCDGCGRTREELGVTHLRSCSRCKKAYYCGAECQRKQWKVGGHKQHCRELGRIEPGDYVRLNGINARPQLNGMVVRVVGPDPKDMNRMEVRIGVGNERSISIAKEKMEQLRPLK